ETAVLARARGALHGPPRARDRARVLLRADRRRPGPVAAHLLLPRPARADVVRGLRVGRLEGTPVPADEGRAGGPRELRRRPPGCDLRSADARHRLDLGEDLVGRVVVLERGPARPLPRPLPLLLRVLHAALLGRPGAGAREHVRGLRALRRRADPRVVPRDQAVAQLHPSRRLHEPRTADDRDAVPHVLRLARGDARPARDPLPARARREAARRAPARASGAPRVTPSEKYTAAAYLVVFVGVLAYVLIIAAKL